MKAIAPKFALIKGVKINESPTFFHCSPAWSADITFHDCDFWLVLGGRGKVFLNGAPHDLREGSAFVFVPGLRLLGTHDPKRPLKVFAVHFDPLFSEKTDVKRFFQPYHWHLQYDQLTVFEHWASQCADTYHSRSVIGRMQAEKLLMVMLLQLWKEADTSPRSAKNTHIQALLSEIRTHPQKKWTISLMCKKSLLSSTYLNQRIRDLTGLSPNEYVIHARIERARVLLEESGMQLEEIADSLGYGDVYFFNRQFSKITGEAPGQYRKIRKGAQRKGIRGR